MKFVLLAQAIIARWTRKYLPGLVAAFCCYVVSTFYFNVDEPRPGQQNQCDEHLRNPSIDPPQIPRPTDGFKIIRLTNSGEFANRCQLTNVLYELNWDRPVPFDSFKVDVRPDAIPLPKLAVLYVHGWKHNADSDDTDLENFKKLIDDLRKKEEGKRKEDGKRYVVGIYVGWNAEAPLWRWFENLTFWVKKTNADRIAQSSSVTEIYSAIGSITSRRPQDQFIAIGHSFGARILYSATAQPLVADVALAHPGFPGYSYRVIDGLSDAIILLNPAFEATRYSAIDGFIRSRECFSRAQAPLMVTISSKGDWATRFAFPLGQWLGLARDERELQTLGNYKPFWTHSLDKASCPTALGHPITEQFGTAELCMRRLVEKRAEHNPFIVATTTSDVISNHNDIWNATFSKWLVELIAALQSQHDVEKRATESTIVSCSAARQQLHLR
ncbi:MAG: hypothetical protein J0H42_18055 [Rhizobiales bacterium]|nr:hypothetical protein [Hyphomicrobiales bacterium]